MIKLFREKSIGYYFRDQKTQIKASIDKMDEDKFMEFIPKDLADNKTAASQLAHLRINLNSKKFIGLGIRKLTNKAFPQGWDSNSAEEPRIIVEYSYDVPDNSELLAFNPSEGFQLVSLDKFEQEIKINIANDKLILQYQTLYQAKGQEKRIELSEEERKIFKDGIVKLHSSIEKAVQDINNDIDKFNENISIDILKFISDRRDEITRRRNHDDEMNEF
jgi:hypothetical protein